MNKKNEKKLLPDGWSAVTISDLLGTNAIFEDGDWIESKDQSVDGSIRLIQLADIGDGYFKNKSQRFMTLERAHELNCKFLKGGDILIARMPEPLGRACIFPYQSEEQYVTVVDIAILRLSDNMNSLYMMHCINSPQIRTEINSLQTGTTRKRISKGNLNSIKFPLAPRAEQDRIVEKIEEIFSEIDHSIESFKNSKIQLQLYWQIVLKDGFEGRFTKKWRQQNDVASSSFLIEKIKMQREERYQNEFYAWESNVKSQQKKSKPQKPSLLANYQTLSADEVKGLPRLPTSWNWVKNEELLYYTTSGSRDWKKYYSKNGGALFIRTQDIKTNSLNWNEAALVDLPENVEGKRSLIEKGDLLMTITGANVGKIALVTTEIPEAYVSQSVALMKPIDISISPYLHLYFQSAFLGGKLINSIVYGVGRPVLNLKDIQNVPVPLPSQEEQIEIVREIETRASLITNLTDSIEKSIQSLEHLKQSVLKKAFNGELVSQLDDEFPASDILQKIREEKILIKSGKTTNIQKSRKEKMTAKSTEIIAILQDFKKPMLAKELWQKSKFNLDIEAFYSELKKLDNLIIEIDKGYLSLRDEN